MVQQFFFLLSGTAVLLGLGIHKYQDQIQELSGQVTQPIKDALEPFGNNLSHSELFGAILIHSESFGPFGAV